MRIRNPCLPFSMHSPAETCGRLLASVAGGRHYGPRRGPVADRVNFEEISKTVTASGKTRCSYRCRQVGCEWAAEGVTRSAPQHHASKAHPEVEGIHVYSAVEGGEVSEDPEEVRRAKSAARSRKYRANKRQQQQQVGGAYGRPISHASGWPIQWVLSPWALVWPVIAGGRARGTLLKLLGRWRRLASCWRAR